MLIIVLKRSLGQGNIFRGVCLSTGRSLYDVTSCLAVWSHVPSRLVSVPSPMFLLGGSLSLVPCSFLVVSFQEGDPWNPKNGQYASYWNAFLFFLASAADQVRSAYEIDNNSHSDVCSWFKKPEKLWGNSQRSLAQRPLYRDSLLDRDPLDRDLPLDRDSLDRDTSWIETLQTETPQRLSWTEIPSWT